MVIGEITNHKYMENYNMSGGNVGAFGSNSSAHNFTQNTIQNFKELDLQKLSEELVTLRKKQKEEAHEKDEYDAQIGAIASAQEAAKEGNGQDVMKFLKVAGKWALDTATKIGTDVAAKAINFFVGFTALSNECTGTCEQNLIYSPSISR